jgi:hypothetical protein
MTRGLVLLLAFLILPGESWAQKAGKPRECFTKPEHEAEQQVRQGIRLREWSAICDIEPFKAGTWPLWSKIDNKFGKDFAKVTESRAKAFEREFPETWKQQIEVWNGRIVLHWRNRSLLPRNCTELKKQLEQIDKKGFSAFKAIAAKTKPEVRMDYKICN